MRRFSSQFIEDQAGRKVFPRGLTLGAGTATASTAPLYFNSGTSLTTAIAGAMEYTTDDLFFTISTGTARKDFLMADPVGGLTSARVPFATTNGRVTDSANFIWDSSGSRLGVGSSIPATMSFSYAMTGGSDGSVGVERLLGAGTGKTLTVQAGGCQSGQSNTSGGTLVLSTGISTGNASAHQILFKTGYQTGSSSSDNSFTTRLTLDFDGSLTLAPAIRGTGTPFSWKITGAAHTALTASVEATDIQYNLNRTVQFSTGAITSQRAARIQAPTYGFVGASTITNAATFAISGAPVAGTNATLTNTHALWVEGGNTQLDGGVTTTTGAFSGIGTFTGTTDSTSNTTGIVKVSGGVGVVKSIFAGGDIACDVAGKGFKVKEGTNAKMGTAVLVLGTVVVNTTAVTATSRIFLTAQVLGTVAVAKAIAVTARTAATSFTITSADLTDTSTIAWVLFDPA